MANSKDFVINVLSDISDSTDKLGVKMPNLVKGAAAAVTAAWTAANVGDVISASFDMEAAADKLAAQMGGTSTDAAAYGAQAAALYSDGFGDSLETANEAVKAVKTNLYDVGDVGASAFNQTAESALNVSTIMGEDITKVTAAVSSMLKSGLASSAQEAFDVITTGAQTGTDKAEDLLDTYTEYSVVFAQLGINATQSLGLMNQGLEAGARNSDIVADALKEFTIRAQEAMTNAVDASKVQAAQEAVTQAYADSSASIKQAIDSTKTAEDSLASAQRDSTQAQTDLTQARLDAKEALANLENDVTNADLSQRSAEIAVQRAQQRLDELGSSGTASSLDMDEAQLAYDQAVQRLDEQKQRVKDLAKEQATADAKGVEGSDQVVAAKQKILDAQASEKAATEKLADAQTAQRQAEIDGAAKISAAQSALAAAQTVTLTTMGKAYQQLGLDGTAIGEAIAQGGKPASEALQSVLDKLRAVEDPTKRMQIAVQIFGTKAEDLQSSLFALDLDTATKGLENVSGAAARMGDTLNDNVNNKVLAAKNSFNKWVTSLVDTKGPVGDIAAGLQAWGPVAAQGLAALTPLFMLMGPLSTASTLAATTNMGFAASLWATTWPILAIIAAVALLVGAVWLIISNWGPISGFFAGLWDGIWKGIQAFVGWVTDMFTTWSPIGILIKNWGAVTDFFGDVGDSIGQSIEDAANWVGDSVGNIIDFFTGIPDAIGDVAGGVTDVVKGLVNATTDGFEALWNGTIGQIHFTVPDWVPLIGGSTVAFPTLDIPHLATGGIVDSPTVALIGEAGPEAVVPLSKGMSLGGPEVVQLEIPVDVQVDGKSLVRQIRRIEARLDRVA